MKSKQREDEARDTHSHTKAIAPLKDEVVIFEEILWPGGKLFSAHCIHAARAQSEENRNSCAHCWVHAAWRRAAALLFDNLS